MRQETTPGRDEEGTGEGAAGWRGFLDLLYRRRELFEKYGPPDWLDQGGYGRIGRLVDHHLRRGVCIKTPKLEGKPPHVTRKDEDVLARFVFEAFLMANLAHPGVPPIHEIGIDYSGLPYYTTKWIRGRTLRDVVADHHRGIGGWTKARLVRVLIRVCETMAYAHKRGILHRDLTDRNIMIGRFGEVFVLDWGLAKVWDSSLFEKSTGITSDQFETVASPPPRPVREKELSPHTAERRVFGTPFFIAPEIVSSGSESATPQADVYSLGVILYFLICRRLPYETESGKPSLTEYLEALGKGPPVPASEIAPGAGGLASICERALAHDRSDRFEDMARLREALRGELVPRERGAAALFGMVRGRFARKPSRVGWKERAAVGATADAPDADFFAHQDLLTRVQLKPERGLSDAEQGQKEADDGRRMEWSERLATLEARTLPCFDYEILGELARGGLGQVFKAFDPRLRRVFALKTVIYPGATDPGSASVEAPSPRATIGFLTEAQITAQLDHPNIVPIHEVGVHPPGHLYYTMELIEGEDLSSFLHGRSADYSLIRLVEIIVQVCEAVAYAHRKGVIHRDIKPSNILVGPLGEVYLIDWGLAHVTSAGEGEGASTPTQSGEIVTDLGEIEQPRGKAQSIEMDDVTADGEVFGTPVYMSPEQMRGDPGLLTGRSDVFALGSTLFHLLTGRMPFWRDGASLGEVWTAKLQGDRSESVRKRNPAVPARLARICDRAMSHSPSDRPTAKQMALELRRFLDDPPRSVRRWRVPAAH